jgi:hypothetical protein
MGDGESEGGKWVMAKLGMEGWGFVLDESVLANAKTAKATGEKYLYLVVKYLTKKKHKRREEWVSEYEVVSSRWVQLQRDGTYVMKYPTGWKQMKQTEDGTTLIDRHPHQFNEHEFTQTITLDRAPIMSDVSVGTCMNEYVCLFSVKCRYCNELES